MTDDSGTSCGTLYAKNPIDVLKSQFELADSNDILLNPQTKTTPNNSRMFSHPLETKNAHEIYEFIRDRTMKCSGQKVFWNDHDQSLPQSFVGFLQLFTDKSSTTIKPSSLTAYPIHVTFLNFTTKFRRKCINSGITLLGYLPVHLTSTEQHLILDETPMTSSSTSRSTKLSILQNALKKCLDPLCNISISGFNLTNKLGINKNCFPILYSYCADFPEAKDILSLVAGANTYKPCHRCYIPRNELPSNNFFRKRSLTDTIHARNNTLTSFNYANNLDSIKSNVFVRTASSAEEQLSNLSIYKQKSFLESSPLLPIDAPCDMYQLCTFEPLHNLYLGISKLLKICTSLRLTSEHLYTTAASLHSAPRTFNSVRKPVLRGVNNILAAIERDFYLPGLHIDFSKQDKGSNLNGVFKENGLVGMLEAKDYRALDMVFPFIGAFIDKCCDEVENAPITSIYTQYSDILSWLRKENISQYWTDNELKLLQTFITQFKTDIIRTFQSHHTSNLLVPKFHLLDHLVDDLKRMGSFFDMQVDAYEYSHIHFKNQYRRTSKRYSTAMHETIERIQRAQSHLLQSHIPLQNSTPRVLLRDSSLIPYHGAVLVRDGTTMSLYQFELTCNDALPLVQHIHGQPNLKLLNPLREFHSNATIQLFSQLGDQAATSFLSLLREELVSLQYAGSSQHVKINMVKSAFVMGGFVPNLDHYNQQNNEIHYRKPIKNRKERIVAANNFGSSKKSSFSFVTMEGDGEKEKCVWIGKVLTLFHLKTPNLNSSLEYAFVQFMEIVPPQDNIDRVLGCLTLRWATSNILSLKSISSSAFNPCISSSTKNFAPWFGLVSTTSIISKIHVLRKNFYTPPFTKQLPWQDHRFYVNRFYYNHSTATSPAE